MVGAINQKGHCTSCQRFPYAYGPCVCTKQGRASKQKKLNVLQDCFFKRIRRRAEKAESHDTDDGNSLKITFSRFEVLFILNKSLRKFLILFAIKNFVMKIYMITLEYKVFAQVSFNTDRFILQDRWIHCNGYAVMSLSFFLSVIFLVLPGYCATMPIKEWIRFNLIKHRTFFCQAIDITRRSDWHMLIYQSGNYG